MATRSIVECREMCTEDLFKCDVHNNLGDLLQTTLIERRMSTFSY